MSDLLQSERVRSTANLIKSEGVWVSLTREPAWIADGAGGRMRTAGVPVIKGPQRVFRGGVNMIASPSNTEEGHRRVSEFVLVGMPFSAYDLIEFDVEVGDSFVVDNDTFTVYSIHHDRTYQVKALCRVVSS